MKKVIFTLIFSAILSSSAYAADKWSKHEKFLLGAALSTTIVDWGQTRDISKNPDKWSEANLILGNHPTTREVDLYFISALIVEAGVAHLLPSKYRGKFLLAVTILETVCIINNHSAGIRINF